MVSLMADKLGIALPQFILDLNGESGGLLLLFTVGLCILLPLVVASIYLWRSSKYTENYVKLQTRQAYYELMKLSLTTSKVMDVFIKAAEYTEIPKLFTSVKSELSLDPKKMKQDEAKFWKQDPAVIKAELLIQKQLTRESAVLSPSLQSDFRRVLEFAPRLLEDLMKMAVIPDEQGHGWLSHTFRTVRKSTSEDTVLLIAGYALVTFDCLVACTLLKDCKFIDRDFPMILFCFRQAWHKLLFH
ncbi:hypothetical protein Bca52824_046203 [Brassica carinata]|uniref:SEC63 domain-containing protein n=1 Tax=Brassica carinata TaxID=52824 RepID=A0A8X7RJI7_BRACI|nr:hypothetical protein Bca52824_046203 [Brassica carinata]